MNELQTATLDEIFEELKSRYAGLALVLTRDAKGDPGSSLEEVYYHGGMVLAVGLCEYGKQRILRGVLTGEDPE